MRKNIHRRKLAAESGMTLIELSIAAVVLVFGMLSIMGLLITAIGNNGRSKLDSTSTMLTQAVVEQISAVVAGGGPGSIMDNNNCDGTGTTWQIDSSIGGASLNGDKINFNQNLAVGGGYRMDYVECVNNIKTTYDVRWNVQSMGSLRTFLITVGARPTNFNSNSRFGFSIPVNMRVYAGCASNKSCGIS